MLRDWDHDTAVRMLFDFTIGDVAMGTGNFLVPAIGLAAAMYQDWITGTYQPFLAANPGTATAGGLGWLARAGRAGRPPAGCASRSPAA